MVFANSHPVSGSTAAPPHPDPPIAPGITTVPWSDGGEKTGPTRYLEIAASAASFTAGVKSITSSSENPCLEMGAGFEGNGCVGQLASPGTSLCGTGRSSIGQSGLPVTRSKTNRNPCLVGATTMSTFFPS